MCATLFSTSTHTFCVRTTRNVRIPTQPMCCFFFFSNSSFNNFMVAATIWASHLPFISRVFSLAFCWACANVAVVEKLHIDYWLECLPNWAAECWFSENSRKKKNSNHCDKTVRQFGYAEAHPLPPLASPTGDLAIRLRNNNMAL